MLVYGDQERRADPSQLVAALNRRLDRIAAMLPGIKRHTALTTALIEAGQLQQGLADHWFHEAQCDRSEGQIDEVGIGLHQLALALCRSWDSGYAEIAELPRLRIGEHLPAEVQVRLPEGFAFYALYAEAYIDAARRLKLSGPPQVIGVRSIGTTLGAVVAAALGAPPASTVRPFGDPFQRVIAVDDELRQRLAPDGRHYIIVDEGPGQSGSSFAAVATWLRERGVPEDRIAVLPSHAGAPGPEARPEVRDWWRSAQRQVADLGDELPALAANWAESVLGRLDAPIRDLSGGAWRSMHCPATGSWPAVVPAWERRKFLVRAGGEPYLLKFAGLGRVGEEKLATARSLHADRLSPEPVGLAHGFLIERWLDDATPLHSETPLAGVARYIGTRARSLRAAGGAAVGDLIKMAKRNISIEFGAAVADTMLAWEEREAELASAVLPVRTDNRMLPHEWLLTGAGALIKTDALDHHQGHDLIGCQDLAWDVAGAIVEFRLNQRQIRELIASVEDDAERQIDRLLLSFYHLAYLAFRLGQTRLGAPMTGDMDERQRIAAAGDGYADRLKHLLQNSLVNNSAEKAAWLISGTNRGGNKKMGPSVEEEDPQVIDLT